MTEKRTAVAIGLTFFVGWLAILYAGADHPPPPGFLVVVLFDLVAAFVVYRRVPVYTVWAQERRPKRWLRATLEGAVAGLITAGLVMLSWFGGEPSVQRTAADSLVFFVVMAVVGAANGLLIAGVSAGFARRQKRVLT